MKHARLKRACGQGGLFTLLVCALVLGACPWSPSSRPPEDNGDPDNVTPLPDDATGEPPEYPDSAPEGDNLDEGIPSAEGEGEGASGAGLPEGGPTDGEGEGEGESAEGEEEMIGEGEGESEDEGEPPGVWLCDYWPLATGNFWVWLNAIDAYTVEHITEGFEMNGCPVWESTSRMDGWTHYQSVAYYVLIQGWLYATSSVKDLYRLPSATGKMQHLLPERLVSGESFVPEYWGSESFTILTGNAVRAAAQIYGVSLDVMPSPDAIGLVFNHEELGEIAMFLLGRDYGPMAVLGGGGYSVILSGIAQTGCVLDPAP